MGRSGKCGNRHRILKEVQGDVDVGRVRNRLTLKGMDAFCGEMRWDFAFGAMGRPQDDRVGVSIVQDTERMNLEVLSDIFSHLVSVSEAAIGIDLLHVSSHVQFLLTEFGSLCSVVGSEVMNGHGRGRTIEFLIVRRIA